ncbi:MAG: hypothetical protein RL213_712 [Bacteroidota bacterium]
MIGIRMVIVSAVILISCTRNIDSFTLQEASSHSHVPDTSLLRQGDIILRCGKGVISDIFLRMSLHDRSFSHAGVLCRDEGKWTVLHMLESESGRELFSESLYDYCSDSKADSIAVFRLTESADTVEKVMDACQALKRNPPVFDERFDLGSDSELYCTELVYKVYRSASSGLISLPLTEIAGYLYCACDNLYLNRYAKQIYPPPFYHPSDSVHPSMVR